jgi:hypothetical protein
VAEIVEYFVKSRAGLQVAKPYQDFLKERQHLKTVAEARHEARVNLEALDEQLPKIRQLGSVEYFSLTRPAD